ncbi:NADH:ubiquinone oxidoreductase, membrane subunit A [Candidatus Kuenenia stuttgartiensis]|uniref:NADH-quinone oxidoreductase subunit A n=1 Tax=Kuenenia stuttgartiensis TaxID=174633 RepID=Q1Q760_KUEST|nr:MULTISPECIES: NADH-quinone oxidoreductase subunit A [Kuenenia]MBE7549019.1 NADH-quinone oxidoreductase subunit A [Planctomycetia bacterium]MBW7846370.1 NADH-quinone oxidoreductase subunit A [Bacteroidia bacterium]MBZ0190749.1 NADH-quinone oxidoreductase subunit A [Candidatus Kuenenia stuttgartiensis]MCF6151575.1 NADH:ubiquinone oxidoreductase subunit A [Candidatus Kuenenia stuttgartiensis]MCL4727322.1 NADH-quinone oxidoreductase subunit A [Candidatus Kuenenia stuttgartiensis]
MSNFIEPITLWPLLLYTVAVVSLVIGILIISYFLGERHKEPSTDVPFESGITPTGSARIRFSAHFYIAAMFFVIFDLEAIFIFAWAVAFRDVGWNGYIGVLIFIGIIIAVLIYVWRLGALDFGPQGKKILSAFEKLKG